MCGVRTFVALASLATAAAQTTVGLAALAVGSSVLRTKNSLQRDIISLTRSVASSLFYSPRPLLPFAGAGCVCVITNQAHPFTGTQHELWIQTAIQTRKKKTLGDSTYRRARRGGHGRHGKVQRFGTAASSSMKNRCCRHVQQ